MSMEPPIKRRRLAGSSYPGIDLQARRVQNDFRLKSIFESIFERYGRDFEGIGDEIDLETGEIVVNNGHIQGMTNERDLGDPENSSKGPEAFDQEDDHSSIEYSEEYLAALGSSKSEDAAVIEGSEASEQSDFDADSLMGDVPDVSHLHELGKKSTRAVSIPSDDEEDELASSDVEWASHSKGRLGVQERFCLLKNPSDFVDEPAIEPTWRAPPLPSITRLERAGQEVRRTSVDNMREYSDDERAGVSLWTPELKKCPRRRRASANSIDQRSLSVARSQENIADELPSNLSDSEPALRKVVKWTQAEEELLAHLKTTTNLTSAAMTSYFPERQRNAIASHWTYMIHRGKASPKPLVPTILERRIPLSSLVSSTDSLAPNGTRLEPHDHDTILETEEPQTVQEQINERSPGSGSLSQSSSKPVAHVGGHYIDSPYQVSSDHRTLADESISIPEDVGARNGYSLGGPFSSARDCGFMIAESEYQVNTNGCRADADPSYSVSKPSEINDNVSTHENDHASKTPDKKLGLVYKNGCGAWEPFASTSIKAQSDSKGAEPFSDGIVSPEIQFRDTTAVGASNLSKRGSRSHSEIQRENSIPPTAEDTIQTKGPMAQGPQKTQSTNLVSTTPAHSSDRGKSGASREPNVDITSKNNINRHIVQVVIPLAPHVRLPLAPLETEDHAFIRQLSTTAKSESAALDPSLSHQENHAIRTPSKSPSVAAAESQYAASTTFVHDGFRTSLGPEVADSQLLSTMPVVATPVPELGEDATRPIILDSESPPLMMSPGLAPSAGKQLKEASKAIVLECDAEPLRVISSIATPARKRIEEATESDILESGSHPLSKPPSAARALSKALSKRTKRTTIGEPSSSIWTAIDDYSEDELSYL